MKDALRDACQSPRFHPRVMFGFALCTVGVLLGILSLAAAPPGSIATSPASGRHNPALADKHHASLRTGAKDAAASAPTVPGPFGRWSIVPSPNTHAAETTNYLTGLTCVSTSNCWAVGSYDSGDGSQTLAEQWDGTSWAMVASPQPLGVLVAQFTGVTCLSSSDCWAVGASIINYYQTLIEQWNGTSWAIVPSPNISGGDSYLSAVACVSGSDCWAVGYVGDDLSFTQALIEQWDGSAWTIVPSPNSGAPLEYLTGVTCVSATNCWAVGFSGVDLAQTLIEQWNGSAWTIVASPNKPAQSNSLSGIACVSGSDCWAVGHSFSFTTGVDQTLIEQWDGSGWKIVTSPNNGTQSNSLSSVTCSSATDCWATGNYTDSAAGVPSTLILRWNGTSWDLVTSPNVDAALRNLLNAVACVPGSANCWAAGYSSADTTLQAIIEQWDGASWAIISAAKLVADQPNILNSVACVSATDCWAVGHDLDPRIGLSQGVIERWDGASWTIVSSPAVIDLTGVTCVSASDCWAVGSISDPDTGMVRALIEQWDGATWSIVTSPNLSIFRINSLQGVTCTSALQCFAVGAYYNDSGFPQTLIEQWNGTSWSIVTSPNSSPTQINDLYGVTCASESDCWAVGYYNTGHYVGGAYISGPDRTLIEHWNGTSWTIVSSPNAPTEDDNGLSSVACSSASDCWAVGYYNPGNDVVPGNPGQILLEQWNGTAWTFVPMPVDPNGAFFNSVTCPSSDTCWAVGQAGQTDAQTFIQRWDGVAWNTVNSPSISGPYNNRLMGVSCSSSADCWAVGAYTRCDVFQPTYTLTEHFTTAQLLNLSARLDVKTGANVLIGGFIVTGTQSKKVILRAIGPSLLHANPPVPGALADPILGLHAPDSTLMTNDNWKDTQEAEIIASGIPPTDDLESAIVATLDPGAYTAIVSGKNGGTGVGLVEVYDLDQIVDSDAANISTRGFVESADNVLIAGFIVGVSAGGGNPSVIVRAIGPSLMDANPPVPGALADPTVELHDSNGDILAFNDNWKDTQEAEIMATTIAPTNELESAIVEILDPGAYTAIVRGLNNTTGVALVEVYNLN